MFARSSYWFQLIQMKKWVRVTESNGLLYVYLVHIFNGRKFYDFDKDLHAFGAFFSEIMVNLVIIQHHKLIFLSNCSN